MSKEVIVMAAPNYRMAPREMVDTLTNMLCLSDSALAQDYRRKLANLLAEYVRDVE